MRSLDEIDQLLIELSPSPRQAEAVLRYLLQECTAQHTIALGRWDTSRELFSSAYKQLSDDIGSIHAAFSKVKKCSGRLDALVNMREGGLQHASRETSNPNPSLTASPSHLPLYQTISKTSEDGLQVSQDLSKRLQAFYIYGSSLVQELQADAIRYQELKDARQSALTHMKRSKLKVSDQLISV
jgi:hypothetical protein